MKWRLSIITLALCACLCLPVGADFDPDTNYCALMMQAVADRDREAGLLAEAARAEKIDELGLPHEKFAYDDLVLLAQLIYTEAGSAWLSAEWRMAVGEVALNRVASPEFPDTLIGVVFQPGQYTAADPDWFQVLVPYDYCVEAAKRLLSGERVIDDPSVVFQSGAIQGSGECTSFTDEIYGTTYFCYSNRPDLYA